MSQPKDHLSDETSDRLYTPEELASYAAAEDARNGSDPLTAQLPDLEHTVVRPRLPESSSPPSPPVSPIRWVTPAAPAGGPPAAQPPSGRPGGPTSRPPSSPPPLRPAGGPPQGPPPSGPPTVAPPSAAEQLAEPRRVMTATHFLERRADAAEAGPATWGWRGRLRRWSGGTIKPRMNAAERVYTQDRALIQKDFDGPVTIAFINPKGGAAKTTGVLAAGYTFGTVRGGGVVAWDNNETRGTLGIRGARSVHRKTTKELLADMGKFADVSQSRIGDLGSYVRSQGDAHFDVLASDESPNVTGQIHADDFNSLHQLLTRF